MLLVKKKIAMRRIDGILSAFYADNNIDYAEIMSYNIRRRCGE